jgi:hypothetical protein
MRIIHGSGNYVDPFSDGFAIGERVYQFRRSRLYETEATDCIVSYDVTKGTSEKVIASIDVEKGMLARFGVRPAAVSFAAMEVIQRRRDPSLLVFEPTKNQLSSLPPPPTPVVGPVLGNVDGKLWLIGGFVHDASSPERASKPFRFVQEYDFDKKEWRVVGETPFLIYRDELESFRVFNVNGKPTLAGRHLGSPVSFELVP